MDTNKAINYYGTDNINKEKLINLIQSAVSALVGLDLNEAIDGVNFARAVLELPEVAELLIHLSRLPVFDTEYGVSLQHDLDLLALTKKLKFFTNLPLCQILLLLQQLVERNDKSVEQYEAALLRLLSDNRDLSNLKLKDFAKKYKTRMTNAKVYLDNADALETIDPHAVYPTSIYRHSNGLTLATPDSQTIEAVMTTSLTTTIKITRGVLDPANTILANMYKPLGRLWLWWMTRSLSTMVTSFMPTSTTMASNW